eukprot:CAMPEP_0117419440 /NCGR_PEP_ID=MMETSP0758-20121206/992_1 /TAXON_ID=63605 /ORGANISM="Percolomonas cosmopolitus, Strain AE-1 (ATCC 50343)" /LENGTH=326 /DNA_ID=CAMNT_0005200487 /DNA_START=21 /DNA_END=998 /DNA_ORIENTATION=-
MTAQVAGEVLASPEATYNDIHTVYKTLRERQRYDNKTRGINKTYFASNEVRNKPTPYKRKKHELGKAEREERRKRPKSSSVTRRQQRQAAIHSVDPEDPVEYRRSQIHSVFGAQVGATRASSMRQRLIRTRGTSRMESVEELDDVTKGERIRSNSSLGFRPTSSSTMKRPTKTYKRPGTATFVRSVVPPNCHYTSNVDPFIDDMIRMMEKNKSFSKKKNGAFSRHFASSTFTVDAETALHNERRQDALLEQQRRDAEEKKMMALSRAKIKRQKQRAHFKAQQQRNLLKRLIAREPRLVNQLQHHLANDTAEPELSIIRRPLEIDEE